MRHRATVKTQLQNVTRLSGKAVQEAAVAGLSADLYPFYQQLVGLNKAAQANVNAAATRDQIALLGPAVDRLSVALVERMAGWERERADLETAGKLSSSEQWEGFLKRVMESKIP